MDEFNLDRFIDGQNTPYANYDRALSEVRNGHKVSHWIWYIFPNLRELGHSKFSKFYGITCREEANEYLRHPILGVRLREITEALLEHEGKAPDAIFGRTDARKVKSCMTLFDCISPNDVFAKVLDSFYNGKRDNCSIISTGEKQENHDNYSVIGHLFLIAIKTFFESFEENAPKPLKSMELFRKGQQIRIPNGKLILLALDCISDPDNEINLFYDGQKSYDGYYFLNYQEKFELIGLRSMLFKNKG